MHPAIADRSNARIKDLTMGTCAKILLTIVPMGMVLFLATIGISLDNWRAIQYLNINVASVALSK